MDSDLGGKEVRRNNLVAIISLSLMLAGMAAMVPWVVENTKKKQSK